MAVQQIPAKQKRIKCEFIYRKYYIKVYKNCIVSVTVSGTAED